MTSDGANLLDPGNQGTQTANINQNQMQEVSLLTSAYGAEFAKGPVTFQAIGKSGSAQFHGQAYLYARNGVFNSVDSYLKNQGGKAARRHFYYPGGDFGGPVLIPGTKFNKNHDKLFFYGAYEYMRQQPAGTLHELLHPHRRHDGRQLQPGLPRQPGLGRSRTRATRTTPTPGRRTAAALNFAPGGMIPADSARSEFPHLRGSCIPSRMPIRRPTRPAANFQYFIGPPQNRWESRSAPTTTSATTRSSSSPGTARMKTIHQPDQRLVAHRRLAALSVVTAGQSDFAGLQREPGARVQPHADQRIHLRGCQRS